MVAVEAVAGIVGGVVGCKRFDDVEFDEGVLGEAVEREVGVSCGVVVGGVVYDSWGVVSLWMVVGWGGWMFTGSGFRGSLYRRRSFRPRLASSLP